MIVTKWMALTCINIINYDIPSQMPKILHLYRYINTNYDMPSI